MKYSPTGYRRGLLFATFLLGIIFFANGQIAPKPKPDKNIPPGLPAKKSDALEAEYIGDFVPMPYEADFQPVLFPPDRLPNDHDDEPVDSLTRVKTEIKRKKAREVKSNFKETEIETNPDLVVNICHGFEGNGNNRCPPDNTLAISRYGFIVSAVNQNLFFFNESGNLLNTISLVDFFDQPGVSTFLCDPKVLYDAAANRFIFFSQTCDGMVSGSKILIAFSSAENPNQPWSRYVLSGSPLNNNTFFDFPKMAVSQNELYITGNLFGEDGSFNQSVLYQIPKWPGYSGGALQFQVWYDIPGEPFTLMPLSYGQDGTYGPGVYMVATNAVFLPMISFYDLTDDMSASNEALNYYPYLTDAYFSPLASPQAAGNDLDAGGTRIQDGFYLYPYIHFVFTASEENGWSTIRYYRVNVADFNDSRYSIISNVNVKDYCYPAISSFSKDVNDQSALLTFTANGASSFPELRVKAFDNDWNTASSVGVKSGLGLMQDCYDQSKEVIRWGDYSGANYKVNSSTPTVWISGCYSGANGSWRTWIAEISNTLCSSAVHETSEPTNIEVSPNPAQDVVHLQITASQTSHVNFLLYAQNGLLVNHLYEATLLEGDNQFSFNTSPLPIGAYYLQVRSNDGRELHTEKIIIQR